MTSRSFQEARASGCKSTLVHDRPFFPKLKLNVETLNSNKEELSASIYDVACSILYYPESPSEEILEKLSYKRILGGNCNVLFHVSGFPESNSSNPRFSSSILIRVFGEEGVLDRDDETDIFAILSKAKISVGYYGRFENGRVEGWLDNSRHLQPMEMPQHSKGIAIEMAKLHTLSELSSQSHTQDVTLWNHLFGWYDFLIDSIANNKFLLEEDLTKVKILLENYNIKTELDRMKNEVVAENASICYCHNDVLAANVMMNVESREIKLIDFEYGGINYLAFDIANHFNEYAGGTDDGIPQYQYFPSQQSQECFLQSYVQAYNSLSLEKKLNLGLLRKEVEAFLLVNNLYWGLWSLSQSANKGCNSGFDYILYAENRFKRYKECT